MLKLLAILFITFLLRIRTKVYGNSSRNNKVTRIQKLLFKKNPLLMLTNQYKALFIILINKNKVLSIKANHRSENSRESEI